MKQATNREVFVHSALIGFGGSLLTAGHQFFYGQSVTQILESAGGSFLVGIPNGYIRLWVYEKVKSILADTEAQKLSPIIGGAAGALESGIVTYLTQQYVFGGVHADELAMIAIIKSPIAFGIHEGIMWIKKQLFFQSIRNLFLKTS